MEHRVLAREIRRYTITRLALLGCVPSRLSARYHSRIEADLRRRRLTPIYVDVPLRIRMGMSLAVARLILDARHSKSRRLRRAVAAQTAAFAVALRPRLTPGSGMDRAAVNVLIETLRLVFESTELGLGLPTVSHDVFGQFRPRMVAALMNRNPNRGAAELYSLLCQMYQLGAAWAMVLAAVGS